MPFFEKIFSLGGSGRIIAFGIKFRPFLLNAVLRIAC